MSHTGAARLVLALLALSAMVVGVWAQFAPHSFYDDFPGGGHQWVAVDGPYNEHLVRDVGGLNLALGVVTVAALVWLNHRLVWTAAAAWLVYSVPHFAYHVEHLHLYPTSDKVGNVISLGLTIVGPALVLVLDRPSRVSRPDALGRAA